MPTIKPSARPSRSPTLDPSFKTNTNKTPHRSIRCALQRGHACMSSWKSELWKAASVVACERMCEVHASTGGVGCEFDSESGSCGLTKRCSLRGGINIFLYASLCTSLSSAPTSRTPTIDPTQLPSVSPTLMPSILPSHRPSTEPTQQPSVASTEHPTAQPSLVPSPTPTFQPTRPASEAPTGICSTMLQVFRIT